MAFPPRFLEELRDRVSLVETVARRVKLRRRGREHVGLCPFHNEKTPSFTVSDEKGFYHCFGCGAHGDVVSFVMASEGLSFPDAVEQLAGAAGLDLPRRDPAEAERARVAVDLRGAVEAACAFFEKQLRMPEGKPALDYLRGRGLAEETIARHRLGFAPERRGALAAALARDGITPDRLLAAGLLKTADGRDEPYEYFRGRIVFPIHDRRGRVIAFGGRALGDAQPKYLNSPETPLFQKGGVLYNHHRAQEAARSSSSVVVVEGYMDAIALDQAGIAHVAAPLGTALTEEQLAALWRMADEPILCFDGDAAGERALSRAMERALPLLQPGKSLRFAALPPGEDPDSLIRSAGRPALDAILAAARPMFEIVWSVLLAETRPDTPERRALLRRRLGECAAAIRDATVREFYANELRARMSALFAPRATSAGRPPVSPGVAGVSRKAALLRQRSRPQRAALAALIRFPELISEFGERLVTLDMGDAGLERLRSEMLRLAATGCSLDASAFRSQLVQAGLGDGLDFLERPEFRRHDWAGERADLRTARDGLAHLFDGLARRALAEELLSEAGRVNDSATAEEIGLLTSMSDALRPADDGGR